MVKFNLIRAMSVSVGRRDSGLMWASERWQHKEMRDSILYHKQTVHVAKVALVLGRNIPYTFQFGYIIPDKFECSTFLYPLLYWCIVTLADFRQKLECSRIAPAHTKVVQPAWYTPVT